MTIGKAGIAAFCGLFMAGTQTVAQGVLPWRLADFPDGGQNLTSAVAEALVDEGDRIAPTCNALRPATVSQLSSGVTGIALSISMADDDNAALIVDGLPDCCRVLTALDVDSRISLGVAIALEARSLAESDLQSAQEMELFVAVCDDDALGRSYELARGDDELGQLIAQVDDPGGPQAPEIPIDSDPGGGLSTNS